MACSGCGDTGGGGTSTPLPGLPQCTGKQYLAVENATTFVCKDATGGLNVPTCKSGEVVAMDGANLACVAVQDTTACPNGLAVMNPSFEVPRVSAGSSAPAPGWEAGSQMPAIIRPGGKLNMDVLESPGHGTQMLNLPGNNSARLQTDLMTTMGKSYTMTFAAAQPLGSTGGGMLQGSLGGGESAKSFQFSDVPVGSWKAQSVTLTATNSLTGKLYFSIGNSGTADLYIDNLCLTSN